MSWWLGTFVDHLWLELCFGDINMSLNSVAARKIHKSAHNSPRHAPSSNASPSMGRAARTPPPSSQSVARPNTDDVNSISAAIEMDEDDIPRQLFAANEAVGSASDGTGSPHTPSYQEKLEARVKRPAPRFRPQSRQKLTVVQTDVVDRSAHHVTVTGRQSTTSSYGDDSSSGGGGGGGDAIDKGQVSFLSSMSLRIKSLEAANRALRLALVAKEKQCLHLQHELHETTRGNAVESLQVSWFVGWLAE